MNEPKMLVICIIWIRAHIIQLLWTFSMIIIMRFGQVMCYVCARKSVMCAELLNAAYILQEIMTLTVNSSQMPILLNYARQNCKLFITTALLQIAFWILKLVITGWVQSFLLYLNAAKNTKNMYKCWRLEWKSLKLIKM